MSDPRDDAFRQLLDDVRRFNRKPSVERREAVVEAAAKLTWEYEATQYRDRGVTIPELEE